MVSVENFVGQREIHKKRLKLFNVEKLRELITHNLISQLRGEGLLLRDDPNIRYGLVAGRIKNGHESRLREIFDNKGWLLVTPKELAQGLRKFASRGYEDDIITMVVKILERNTVN